MRKTNLLLALILVSMTVLSACSPSTTPKAEPVTLKIAILPIIDSLPMYVAEKENLFAKHNLNVEFIPVASAPDRDQLIASGQADGMINETLSTIMFNKENVQVQIVRYALVPTADSGHFFILASGKSDIETPEDLKGVEIGVSQGTVIEYVTDRMLQKKGLTPEEITTISVPKMSDRAALLASGELKAAVLPDPLATLAIQQGAKVVLSDSKFPQYGYSVYTFSTKTINTHPGAVKSFLASIEDAITLINKNPARYGSLLSDKKVVPANLVNTYVVPTFPTKDVPTREEWNDSLEWAQEKGLVGPTDVSYTASVNPALLPKD
jgi:NitT/TauT family transport system substrate-binding protein